MSAFIPKRYQQSVLDSVERYFREIWQCRNANKAFYNTMLDLWKQGVNYHAIDGFAPDMPYFCLRLPTGGGKTWLAAKSVALVNRHLLRESHSVILWLVPSKAIREQTLAALREREHPYHQALREAGPVTVLDLAEAQSVTRATLDSSTTVIVATVQAFRRQDTDGLKVFESNGALMSHFEHLVPAQVAELDRDAEGNVVRSLGNVLRLRRPFLVVDEAHNDRTPLSFATFAGFRPSGIMELTATPDTEHTPSNVLHSVAAAELKSEHMIKLPIRLETEGDWQKCLAYAIDCRQQLQAAADAEQRRGAPYLRPLVLIQAEARRKDVQTRDVDYVREELLRNHGVREDEVVIETGSTRGLARVEAEYARGIADADCSVKYVITQQALAEGWDCPSAYILASMAELRSSTAVEQLLGRVLRQPGAVSRKTQELNQSYAFVVSRNFGETATALRDRLVDGAGFERREVGDFVTARKVEQGKLDVSARPGHLHVRPVVVELAGKPDLRGVQKSVRDKLAWDAKAHALTIKVPLDDGEAEAITARVEHEPSRQALTEATQKSRASVEVFQTPAEQGRMLEVPQMALRIQGELQLFDDPEVLDYPWELSPYDADPTRAQWDALDADRVAEGGEIDIDDDSGKVKTTFIDDLQRDLGFTYQPEHWDATRLATWLANNLPETAITHASKRAFIAHWLRALLNKNGFDLARVNRQKFLMRLLLERRVRELRAQAVKQTYQQTLFADDVDQRASVGDEYRFVFNPQGYAPTRDYHQQYGQFDFRKHYYGRIGDFDSGEEFQCACELDKLAQQGRMQFWVRNLVRKEGCSFFLQKSDGRFYPDFLCKRNDGSILVVEYKGEGGWAAAQDDRDIGGLWASLSHATCHFLMLRDRQWESLPPALG